MAPKSAFTPKASLTEAPTNLKEAIDWVLRVTGKDGNSNNGECICGLAAAVTDLLQSVQLDYHGYQGETKGAETNKGASADKVQERLNGLFSLVQGLGGTSVVRTYIDQLAQVLSALVGWSRIDKCTNGGDKCTKVHSGDVNGSPHGGSGCKYLADVDRTNRSCDTCGCLKWKVENPDSEGTPLGRKCQRCKDSGRDCSCGDDTCSPDKECECAKAGKCCKCCCKDKCDKCNKDDKCRCTTEESIGHGVYKDSYMSAYTKSLLTSNWLEEFTENKVPTWQHLERQYIGVIGTPSNRRHHCARILLGSVCLIWSGITYMHWTGKYAPGSPYWNNHILDGSGLDDGSLSQWLQALGFPKTMLNDAGPGNRWDAVIWDGFMGKLFLGFTHPTISSGQSDGTTAKQPYHMNYAGFVHTAHRDSFNNEATVFPNGSNSSNTQDNDTNQHKIGAVFKLYILSCAYFTGLQKKTSGSTTQTTTSNTPRTIREILYWLSALPYSQAYKGLLGYGKERLEKVLKKPDGSSSTNNETQLKFYQQGRNAPITVHEFNLFAHFQAVTQYCPLVLIGIQGGLKGTDSTKEPAIHSLYANTECSFTYPTVDIQAYNQVVHYIRALFYQLYFLRKQCAVKVALGGKWRECRYGDGVVSKGVISWMCLGCNPMEHDRKCRVNKVKGVLDGVIKGKSGDVAGKLRELLLSIGDLVVQLGNAQERLDRGKDDLDGVKNALNEVFTGVYTSGNGRFQEVLKEVLGKRLKEKVNGLEKAGGLNGAKEKAEKALQEAKDAVGKLTGGGVDTGKNLVSAAIDGLQKALVLFKEGVGEMKKEKLQESLECLGDGGFTSSSIIEAANEVEAEYATLLQAIDQLISLCNSPKCSACNSHATKCGQKGTPTMCKACGSMTTTGVPSPLQAFLEDRLPGFSCNAVPDGDNPAYPPAASHLGHCGGSGQCCPLPMGFRGHFHGGSINDCTGVRLYGILYFFSNENMMQSCVYTLVRVTAELSATTPQVLGDVFGFFRGGIGEKERGKNKNNREVPCDHTKEVSKKGDDDYFCGWCASGLREEVKSIEWIQTALGGKDYRTTVGTALINIKGEKGTGTTAYSSAATTTTNTSLSRLTTPYLSPLTGELYTAVSATFGGTYLSWVLYLSDALEGGLRSLSDAFKEIECRGCRECDPNKCKKGEHGQKSGLCGCQSIVSCTGVLPVLYRHGFSYGNPFNLEGYQQKDGSKDGQYDIMKAVSTKRCHEFLSSLSAVIDKKKQEASKNKDHPLTKLLSEVGKLQYDIRLPWIFVLTVAWLLALLYLAFGAIWPLDWTHMRSHWLRGGEHQWQCMWYKVMTGRKGVELMEYFGRKERE